MQRLASVFLLLLPASVQVLAETSAVRYETDSLSPANMPPTFDNGFLAVFELGGIAVYGPEGKLRCRITNPKNGSIRNVAIDSSGTIAATVGSSNDEGSVWLWNPSGLHIRTIETGSYQPSYVAFAPDGSLRITGAIRRVPGIAANDYHVLRHISREGALLGSYLPRSSFATEREPADAVTARPGIRIANGRIGMYFSGGHKQRVWVEVDLKGNELGRWLLDFDGYPIAVTESGAVYARGGISGIYLLDRAAGKWIPATWIAGLGALIGAERESLVFAGRGNAMVYRTASLLGDTQALTGRP